MAERVGEVSVQVDTLTTLGVMPRTPADEALVMLTKAAKLAKSAGLLDHAERVLYNLATQYFFLYGDQKLAIEHFSEAAALAHQSGNANSESRALATSITQRSQLGNLQEIEKLIASLHQLNENAQVTGTPVFWLRIGEALLYQSRGEFLEAAKRYKAIQEEIKSTGDLQVLGLVEIYLGEVLIELGKFNEAESVLQEAVEIIDQRELWGVWPRCILVRNHARKGEFERAHRLLTEACEQEKSLHHRIFDTMLRLTAEIELAIAEENWAEASDAIEALLPILEEKEIRWWRTYILYVWGKAQFERDETEAQENGRNLLQEALGEFEDMGAPGYVDMVSNLL
jgi:tetratricopeptide (TPR) repeat protein